MEKLVVSLVGNYGDDNLQGHGDNKTILDGGY